MQFLSVIPEQVESAAQDLAGIRSALSASYAAAAGPTTAVVSAAEDEVSTAIASIFGAYGRQCQVLSAQASAFHDEFVNLLKTGATAYRNRIRQRPKQRAECSERTGPIAVGAPERG